MKSTFLPAFGGFTSRKGMSNINASNEFKSIFENAYCKLFVSNETANERLTNFVINDSKFIWTGGFSKNIDLQSFNPNNNDEKFVFIEFNEKSVNLYTDHYSRIPLFISVKDEVFYFSSSFKMLQRLMAVQSFKVDYKGVLFYYNFGFTNYNNHLTENIESVSGGKHIHFDIKKNVIDTNTYYNIYTEGVTKKKSNNLLMDNIRSIDEALHKSTEKTLGHFNTIGIAMSGGVDSGYLAQKINECGRSFNSYSIGYKDGYNEFDRVDHLSKVLNFETKKIIIDEKDIIDNFLKVSEQSSCPIYFNNSILNFVYEEANRDNVDVIFDGDGADRMFLGSNSFIRLNKVLKVYRLAKKLGLANVIPSLLKSLNKATFNNIRFYFERFNHGYPFYGLRQLSDFNIYDKNFETLLNEIALPKEIPNATKSDDWLYFIMFSIYYFSPCFLHNQYELQIKYNIASNPQFWTDDLVDLALKIPLDQKIHKRITKHVLREAAKTKIDDGYWGLTKIGLQNSYNFIKGTGVGKDFINSYTALVKQTDEYLYLQEKHPGGSVDAERLIPYYIWKKSIL